MLGSGNKNEVIKAKSSKLDPFAAALSFRSNGAPDGLNRCGPIRGPAEFSAVLIIKKFIVRRGGGPRTAVCLPGGDFWDLILRLA